MKKSISIILSSLLLTTQTYAFSLSNSISTSQTSPSSYRSPTTDINYVSSGSFQFTFNKRKSFAPIFVASSTSDLLSVGCNGASLKEMYVGLLDLNEIKDQLSQMGSQIAWGVMVALISSLPTIGDVFTKLQEWARAIQNLMGQGCQIGQNLINNTEIGKSIKGAVDRVTGPNDSLTDYLPDVMNGWSGQDDGIQKWMEQSGECAGLVGDAAEACKAKISQPVAANMATVENSQQDSAVTGVLKDNENLKPNKASEHIYIDTAKKYFESGKLAGKTLLSGDRLIEAKNSYVFARLFTTIEVPLRKSLTDQILTYTDCEIAANKVCSLDINAIGNLMKSVKSGAGGPKLDFKSKKLSPILNSPIQRAHAIMYGLTKSSSTVEKYPCANGTCTIPEEYIILGDFTLTAKTAESSTDTAAKVARFISIFESNNINGDTITVTWEGALKESYKSIKYLVKQSSGIDGDTGIINYETIDCSSGGIIDMVIPGIGKYISIIATLEKNARAETTYTASLKELLAKYNAYLFSKSFLERIYSQLEQNTKEKDEIKKEISSGMKEFDEILRQTNNFKTVIEIFEKVEMQLKENTTKRLR